MKAITKTMYETTDGQTWWSISEAAEAQARLDIKDAFDLDSVTDKVGVDLIFENLRALAKIHEEYSERVTPKKKRPSGKSKKRSHGEVLGEVLSTPPNAVAS